MKILIEISKISYLVYNIEFNKFMDITLVSIVFFILIAIVFLILFLFKSINDKSFIGDYVSVFKKQSDLEVDQNLYEKTKILFSVIDDNPSREEFLDFEPSFIAKIKTEGFKDFKTIVKYRIQLKKLSDLINT